MSENKVTEGSVSPDGSRLREWLPHLDDAAIEKLKIYLAELLKFNKKLNLISAQTVAKADSVHIADAVLAWRVISPHIPAGELIFDFGSGNGIPGLIFAALSPSHKFRLVDRDSRKLEFLKYAGATLKLGNVSYSSEDVDRLPGGSVKFAVSRGFAPVGRGLLLTGKAFASGGKFFMLKGEGWTREVAELPPQIFGSWETKLTGQYLIPESMIEYAVVEARRK